jgi:hypothetical protein
VREVEFLSPEMHESLQWADFTNCGMLSGTCLAAAINALRKSKSVTFDVLQLTLQQKKSKLQMTSLEIFCHLMLSVRWVCGKTGMSGMSKLTLA